MILSTILLCCCLCAVAVSLPVPDSKHHNTHILSKLKEDFQIENEAPLARDSRFYAIGGSDWRDFINNILGSNMVNNDSGLAKKNPSLGQIIGGQQWRRSFNDEEMPKRRLRRGSYAKIIAMAKERHAKTGSTFSMGNTSRGGYTALRMSFGK